MHNPFNKLILGKGKNTLHTIACLTTCMHVFCHTYVEILLKGPVHGFPGLGIQHLNTRSLLHKAC